MGYMCKLNFIHLINSSSYISKHWLSTPDSVRVSHLRYSYYAVIQVRGDFFFKCVKILGVQFGYLWNGDYYYIFCRKKKESAQDRNVIKKWQYI